MNTSFPNRRFFNSAIACGSLSALLGAEGSIDQFCDGFQSNGKWQPKYMLASCMYGYESLEKILPEVAKIGASAIDLWPRVHGNQREQVDEMGLDRFKELLETHEVSVGCMTQYKLGPFGLQGEMHVANELNCQTMITATGGPANLKGLELKSAVQGFVEKMKPHLELAENTGVTIAIENHANSLIESPDSMKYLAELCSGQPLALAFAPYHLPQDEKLLSELIVSVGDAIEMFYAWQHGNGCMNKMPKEQELLQLPGRGDLDFQPLFDALAEINYDRWTEIFMHPFPRGVPILERVEDVTREINRAREYLATLVE